MSSLPALPERLTLYAGAGAMLAAQSADAALMACATFAGVMTQMGGVRGASFAGEWLPALIVERLLATEASGAWTQVAGDARGVQAATRTIMQVRRAGITATAMARRQGSAAWTDLGRLLQRYEEALAAGGLYDAADRERQAVFAAAQGRLPEHLAGVRHVEVQVGCEVFSARLDWLGALASRGIAVRVAIPWDADRSHAFAWPEAMLHAIEARGHQGIEVMYEPRHGRGPLAPLRRVLFTGEGVGAVPVTLRDVPPDACHIHHCVQQLAAWADLGVPLHRMAAVLPDMAGEATCVPAAELAAAMMQAGLGVRGAPPPMAWSAAPARGLMLLLQLADVDQDGVDRDGVVQAWRLWGVPVARDAATAGGQAEASACFDVDAIGDWLQAVSMVRLRRGSVDAALLQAADAAQPPASADEAAAVAAAIATWEAEVCGWPAAADLAAHVQVAQGWLRRLAAHPVHGRHVPQMLAALQRLADDARRAGHTAMVSRQACSRWFAVVLQAAALDEVTPAGQGVSILPPEAVVGRQFTHVLVVGANAGIFPRPVAHDGLLTEALRAEVNTCFGPRLMQAPPSCGSAAAFAHARDRWLWLEVLAACQEQLAATILRGQGEDEAGVSELIEAVCSCSQPHVVPLRASYDDAWPTDAAAWLRARAAVAGAATSPAAPALPVWPVFPASSPQAAPPQAAPPQALEVRPPQSQPPPCADPARPLRACWEDVQRRAARADADRTGRPPRLTPSVRHALRRHLECVVHTATGLDELGICRYRHFAATGLGLRPRQPLPLAIGARRRGSVAHAALAAAYAAVQARGGLASVRLDLQAVATHVERALVALAPQLVARARVHPALQPALMAEARRAVALALAVDEKRQAGTPVALEYGFGPNAASPALRLVLPGMGVMLQVAGIIDRLDVLDGRSGSPSAGRPKPDLLGQPRRAGVGASELQVLDYKSTVRPRPPGRHFQLAAYAAVALRDLGGPATQVGTAWLGLWSGRRHEASAPVPSENFLPALGRAVEARLAPSLRGDVAPDAVDPEDCRVCDFARLCRYVVERHAPAEPGAACEPQPAAAAACDSAL